MKKFIFSTLAALFTVLPAVSAQMCDACKLYIKDFAIKKGETKEVLIYLDNPDYDPTALQFDISFTGGITPVCGKDNKILFTPKGRTPNNGVATGGWKSSDTFYRYIFYSQEGTQFDGEKGAVYSFEVTTDDTFNADSQASITIANARFSDIEHTETSHRANDASAHVYEALDYSDLFNDNNEGKIVYLNESIKIMGAGKNHAFAIDQSGNWLKLIFPADDNVYNGAVYEKATVGGYVSDVQLNPTIVVTNPDNLVPSNDHINAGIESINLTDDGKETKPIMLNTLMNLNANQIIYMRGHYFIDENGNGCLSAYSGKNGPRGITVNVNSDLLETPLIAGHPYDFRLAAIQFKAPWDTPSSSPRRIASGTQESYTNYIVYPLQVEDIVTSIDGVTTDKGVKSVRYYNVAGHESTTPFSGMNIVVTTHHDGTTTTTKIIK